MDGVRAELLVACDPHGDAEEGRVTVAVDQLDLLQKLEKHRAWLLGTAEGGERRRARLREAMHVELRDALTEAALHALGSELEEAVAAVAVRHVDPYTAAERLVEAFRAGNLAAPAAGVGEGG